MNEQKDFRKIVSLPLAMLLIMLASMMLTQASTVVQAQGPDALPAPPPITDPRFGIVQAYDTPEMSQAAGVGWTRAFLAWDGLQPGPTNAWNPHYLTDALKWKQGLGQNIPMAGLLVHTPKWASRGKNEDNLPSTVPDGLDEPYGSSQNLWAEFVRQAMQEYGDYINDWIIWNEPDTWNSPKCTYGSWNGTEEEYVQLLKSAYQAKQEFNQDAKIVMAATTYWHDLRIPDCGRGEYHYISKVLETINQDPEAKANNGFFDAVGINLYLDPDQMYKIIKGYEGKLNSYGYNDKEIWLTETNVQHLTENNNRPQHPDGGTPAYQVTLEEQGHFLVAGWAMSMAAGADRIEFYKTKDIKSEPSQDERGSPFGLQRSDGSLRPVFWTYRTISTYLSGYESVEGGGYLDVNWTVPMATQVVVWPKEYGARRVVVNRGDLGWTTVVWNRESVAQMVSVPAKGNSGTALLADSFGPIGQIQAVGGYYQLNLPGRYEEDDRSGGTVYLIVEGAGADMRIERPTGYTDITGQFYTLNVTNPNPTTVTLFPQNPVSPPAAPSTEAETGTEDSTAPSTEVSPEPEAEASPEPEAEPEPIPADLNCSIEGAAYYLIPIDTPPDLAQLDSEHPDLNLRYRGYEEVQGPLGLLDYGGDVDPEAPQLAGLFKDGRIPTFTSLYQVYDWNWELYQPGGLLNDPWRPASLVGMQTRQGEQILLPDRKNGAIYQGVFKAVVIYASENQITLKYTRDDDVIDGYTVHIENVCVDPALLEMYRRENAAFRTKLPALEGGQPVGVAIGREILVAIRDKGNFMDPRSRKDWWRENAVTSANFSAVAPQAAPVPPVSTINSAASVPAQVAPEVSTINSAAPEVAPQVSTINSAAPAQVAPQVTSINSVTSPQKVVSASRSVRYQFK